jgi:hypothetical protein
MSTEHDSTRIVRSWLEAGSTAMPDRVLDAVLAELPSRPQRRSRWSPWRSPLMKLLLPVAAAVAAVALVAIALGGQFLSNDSSVGGPTNSTVPSPTPISIGGEFTVAGDIVVAIDGRSDGTSLSGTVNGSYAGDAFTIDLKCLRQYDDQTWMLAGTVTESAVPANPFGSWAAVIVRDGSPQKAAIYPQPRSTASVCEMFVNRIPDNAVEGPEMIDPMDEGSITLPPAPAASPAN